VGIRLVVGIEKVESQLLKIIRRDAKIVVMMIVMRLFGVGK
jgi:hypothetical protein